MSQSSTEPFRVIGMSQLGVCSGPEARSTLSLFAGRAHADIVTSTIMAIAGPGRIIDFRSSQSLRITDLQLVPLPFAVHWCIKENAVRVNFNGKACAQRPVIPANSLVDKELSLLARHWQKATRPDLSGQCGLLRPGILTVPEEAT